MAKSSACDAAGNTTGSGALTLSYDGRGRLTGLSTGHSYQINGMGQRVAKAGPGVATGANYFVYDDQGRLLGEYDAGGALREELIYLADTPVATVRPKTGGGVDVYFIYSDHLNSPRVITTQANRKAWEWKLDTFGAGAPNKNPSALGGFVFNLRFPGQYFDAETGLHYNYFRDYDPSIGRYTESDPIGLRGGINTYAYVGGNPVSRTDPLGLQYGLPWTGSPNWHPTLPPPNGNFGGGCTPQDNICTLPGAIGRGANANRCVLACCQAHDARYTRFGCNASSWYGNFGGYNYACQQCNAEASRCIAKTTISSSTSCSSCQ